MSEYTVILLIARVSLVVLFVVLALGTALAMLVSWYERRQRRRRLP